MRASPGGGGGGGTSRSISAQFFQVLFPKCMLSSAVFWKAIKSDGKRLYYFGSVGFTTEDMLDERNKMLAAPQALVIEEEAALPRPTRGSVMKHIQSVVLVQAQLQEVR